LSIERHAYFLPTITGRLIDVPFRLEGVLINLLNCHWFVRPPTCISALSAIYKMTLWKLLSSIHQTSYDRQGNNKEGINLFIVARKAGKNGELNKPSEFVCPKCRGKLEKTHHETNEKYVCHHCCSAYPVWNRIPVLLTHAATSTI
jgi:uncharacterized protein YbaR (Trm112 family)